MPVDPNSPATDERIVTHRMKVLTPEQAFADVVSSLEEACRQTENDANKLMPSVHGRHLAALAKKWRDALTAAKAARP